MDEVEIFERIGKLIKDNISDFADWFIAPAIEVGNDAHTRYPCFNLFDESVQHETENTNLVLMEFAIVTTVRSKRDASGQKAYKDLKALQKQIYDLIKNTFRLYDESATDYINVKLVPVRRPKTLAFNLDNDWFYSAKQIYSINFDLDYS